jgi:[ribosomal protein S5]-alanine N-acetyltransferase
MAGPSILEQFSRTDPARLNLPDIPLTCMSSMPAQSAASSAYRPPMVLSLPYPEPQLRGSMFILRPFQEGDFRAASELGRDPATGLSMPPLPAVDPASVVGLFEQYRADGELLHLVIAELGSDSYLGEVMVMMCEHQVGEFGCGVVPHYRGRGVATEALGMIARWSATALGIRRLQVLVAQENTPALRLSERVGFRREGVLRAYWGHGGLRLDVVMLSMLPDEIS